MKKLRLDLDQVAVESFATVAPPAPRGTVAAREQPVATEGCSRFGCSDDGNCSWAAECSYEVCSDWCTGYDGCSENDNCSQFEMCTGLRVCYWTP